MDKETENKVIDIVKQKKKNSGSHWMKDLSADSGEPGDNSRYVRYALASWNLPPIDISDPKQVENRLTEYFSFCVENDRKPQVIGMCNWLGINRDTLNTWVRGVARAETHTDIIKRAYAMLEEMWADFMLNGKINPASGIFLSKNWFNYKDVADVVVTPNNPMQGLDAEEAKKRLIEGIPDEE